MDPQKDFITEHTFPNGMLIDDNFEIDIQYKNDLNLIDSSDKVINHINKWKYVFPHLTCVEVLKIDVETFKLFKNSTKYQSDHQSDENAWNYLDIIIPYELLKYYIIARKFEVPLSIAILQCWNTGLIEEKNGYWILNSEKEKQ